MYLIAPNFVCQKVSCKHSNHSNVNFRNKSFVTARGEPTPTADCSKFCNWMLYNHEIYKNAVPQKLRAIHYMLGRHLFLIPHPIPVPITIVAKS